MSVTTTANPATQQVLRVLADYDLTHTEDLPTHDASVNQRDGSEEIAAQNPDWWPENYNGVPPYRPINYELDREQRPWARPGVETAFAWTMLNGVGIVAVGHKWPPMKYSLTPREAISNVWRATGGRVNDKIFRFSIGGER